MRAPSPLQPQLPLEDVCPVAEAVAVLSLAGVEERGAIFTRREVVEFMLDLIRYTTDRPLHTMQLLEPSFGDGDFLLPVIDRLLAGAKRAKVTPKVKTLGHALFAVELHTATQQSTKAKVIDKLIEREVPQQEARALAEAWLHQGDFLLQELASDFDFVIGNPPYVRQEMVPDVLMAEYRARYSTIYDRADLYVPFIEHSLGLLKKGGRLCFICADRWMKNRYGGPLRQLVAKSYHLEAYIDMVDTPAFHSEVIAYPAITVIARDRGALTRIARRPEISAEALGVLACELVREESPAPKSAVRELSGIAAGAEPWLLEASDTLALARRLEADFPLLEEAGCKVGIGVATGADNAFIGPIDELDVEADRKLPLVMTRDILEGHVKWRGLGVINPFNEDGGLVNLKRYPKLRKFLEARKDQIAKRHIAEKSPANWYRTIDRIYPALASKPKLLIPDIKGEAHIVYEDGKLYPHHNLYFITSDEWDLKALQAVLRSGIARLFIATYSTRMRGGYLRFQAQYLRRIRVPAWKDVPAKTKKQLIEAADKNDTAACNEVAFQLYRLTPEERAAIGENEE